jgi:hypothetical protein
MRRDVPTTSTHRRPPMSAEQRAALEAAGVKFGMGELLRDFKPLPQRPRWLAFLWRQFHRVFPETEGLRRT